MQQNTYTPPPHLRDRSPQRESPEKGVKKRRRSGEYPITGLDLFIEPTVGRVLLAEDDADMRAFIAAMLRCDNYDVVEFCDGSQLLRHLESLASRQDIAPPDLIISDYRMPKRSGVDILTYLRWNNWPLPCILMTGSEDAAIHNEAKAWGAACVLLKPFDPAVLERTVLELLPPM